MKIVLDTNVLISSFIFKGKAATIHEYCIRHYQIYTSSFILHEFYEKMEKKFKTDAVTMTEIKFRIENDFERLNPKGKMPDICRDPDDNNILHLAKAIQADFIITGDKDLLDLKFFKKN